MMMAVNVSASSVRMDMLTAPVATLATKKVGNMLRLIAASKYDLGGVELQRGRDVGVHSLKHAPYIWRRNASCAVASPKMLLNSWRTVATSVASHQWGINRQAKLGTDV